MKQLSINLPAKEVDQQLLDKWGIGIYKFAQVFAVSPIDFLIQKGKKPFSSQDIKAIKLALKDMLEDILKGARKIGRLMNKAGGLPIIDMSDSELLKEEAIRKFWLEYIVPHEMIFFTSKEPANWEKEA